MLVDSLAAPELAPVALAVYGLARAPPRPSHVDHPRVLSVVLEDRMTPTPSSSLVSVTAPNVRIDVIRPCQRRLRRRINAAAAGTHATVVVDGSGTLANAAARSASNPAGAPGIAPAPAAAAADDGSATL
jgi:hypothetical protein